MQTGSKVSKQSKDTKTRKSNPNQPKLSLKRKGMDSDRIQEEMEDAFTTALEVANHGLAMVQLGTCLLYVPMKLKVSQEGQASRDVLLENHKQF